MWNYPELDPIALELGPLRIHWYAISYLVGIGLAWLVLNYRIRVNRLSWTNEDLSDIVFYAVLGVIVGGRMGYMLFYGRDVLAQDPLALLRVWEGGMSFHGGMLGVAVSLIFYARSRKRRFFEVTDFIAPAIPLGLGSGRIGNFINTELPGRVTDVPWALVYPGEMVGRHPSSLYQAGLEGPVLFALLWIYSMKDRPVMAVTAMFLIGYGSLRFISEFYRQPDGHLGYVLFDWMTTGQMLSLPMVLVGVAIIFYSYQSSQK